MYRYPNPARSSLKVCQSYSDFSISKINSTASRLSDLWTDKTCIFMCRLGPPTPHGTLKPNKLTGLLHTVGDCMPCKWHECRIAMWLPKQGQKNTGKNRPIPIFRFSYTHWRRKYNLKYKHFISILSITIKSTIANPRHLFRIMDSFFILILYYKILQFFDSYLKS